MPDLPAGGCNDSCLTAGQICDFCQYFYNLTAWHENEETCECNEVRKSLGGWCVRHDRETGIANFCEGYLCFRLPRVEQAAPEHGTPEGAALVKHINEKVTADA